MGEIADALRRVREAEALPESDESEKGSSASRGHASRAPERSGDGAEVLSGALLERQELEKQELEKQALGAGGGSGAASASETIQVRSKGSSTSQASGSAAAVAASGDASLYRDVIRSAVAAGAAAPEPVARERQKISRDLSSQHFAARIGVAQPSADASHRYRHMAIRLSRAAAERGAEIILVTSPQMGDGKTTTACNLAVALSRFDQGRHVALVDLDLHRPSVAASLGLEVELSVADVLRGNASISEAMIPTDIGGLHVLGSRRRPKSVGKLLSGANLKALIQALRAEYSLVIVDTPPILVTSDAASILNIADACLLVSSAGRSSSRLVKEALAQVPREKMIGACVNRARVTTMRPEYGYGDYSVKAADEPSESTADSKANGGKG